MGILNILGYIGVGLVVALILMGISFAMSRPKQTVVDGNYNIIGKQRGDGDWAGACAVSFLIMCVFVTLLLFNLAHFSIIKSIGLGVLASLAITILMLVIVYVFYKNIKRMTDHTLWLVLAFILCALNGAGFAVLVSVWGWF